MSFVVKYLGLKRVYLLNRKIVIFYTLNLFVTLVLFLWLFFTSKSVDNASFFALGSLVYILGLKHAFDADHLAAIDNSTRKLIQEEKPAMLCGFFFSLGHSTVVLLLCLALIVAQRTVFHTFSGLQTVGSEIAPVISGLFLFVIGLLNSVVFLEMLQAYKRAKRGKAPSFSDKRGFASRLFKGLFKTVRAQHYMYPIGFLFGLGFDTATETALLAISVAEASALSNVALTSLLVYPLLFATGMTLVDTTDGFFMNVTYQWSFSNYLKKIRYNLAMTALSIFVAYFVGGLELLSVLQNTLNLRGSIWNAVQMVTSNFWWGRIGVFIVLSFVTLWLFSLFSGSKKDSRPCYAP